MSEQGVPGASDTREGPSETYSGGWEHLPSSSFGIAMREASSLAYLLRRLPFPPRIA